MESSAAASHTFRIGDDVDLHYWEAGSESTLLMLPGWAQTAAMFLKQLEGLCGRCHCIAIDHHGHTASRLSWRRFCGGLQQLVDPGDRCPLLGATG
jgi:pimeloyl-ACP methyl ester carboxylesterase